MEDVADLTVATNPEAWARTCRVVAGGVSSNMRARGVPRPLVVHKASGARLWDVEGNELIDVNMGYGCHLFGYGPGAVADAVGRQFGSGSMTGLPHEVDHVAAGLVVELVPGAEQVRFANSGTEAVASALRLARMATGRPRVLGFFGHYHGWSEAILRAGAAAGPKAAQPRPGAAGMAPEALAHVAEAKWNDTGSVRDAFAAYRGEIACVILEPVAANAGVVPPAPGFLEFVRQMCTEHGALLVFDEVITGFRVARGGAQERYGVLPDITVLSKAMGAGFPVSALAGPREVMAPLARNEAFHAGVYAGNHTALAAVAAVLGHVQARSGLYEELEHIGAKAQSIVADAFADAGERVWLSRVGSLMSVACTARIGGHPAALGEEPVDALRHRRFQMAAQERGLYFHPDPLEPWFLSAAHGDAELRRLGEVVRGALGALRSHDELEEMLSA